LRSMTGYGEKNFGAPRLHAKISIKSLNHRFFDWNYKGTPLGELENKLRSTAQKKLQRGRVEASMEVTFLDSSAWEVSINEGLLDKILGSLEQASRRLDREPFISVDNIFRIPQLVELKRKSLSAAEAAFLEESFDETLEMVMKQRRREGRETAGQIRKHLRLIRQSLKRIDGLARVQSSLFRQRVEHRLKELNTEGMLSSERLEEEIASLAQRADIAEEMLRLRAHIDSFEKMVQEERDEPVGKLLDFLSQEIYREANTINSKSQDIDIIRESLGIKGEVESIRQHVQNLE
jgi:uncharacterized protein (TIGR00255 family)